MAETKNKLLIVNHSGYLGTRKPCNNCGKCEEPIQNFSEEPMFPTGIEPDKEITPEPDLIDQILERNYADQNEEICEEPPMLPIL